MSKPDKLASAPESEFSEWVKLSRTTAIEFCKTLLTTSTGAIPIYFAVLKYLGIGQTGGSFLTILPPCLFLLTAILCIVAIRPWFTKLTETGFDEFRSRRLSWLNGWIIVSSILFVIGAILAIVLFFLALPAPNK